MGRKAKYKTYEELLKAKRVRALEYKNKNRDEINKKQRDRYRLLKEMNKSYDSKKP